jgi:phospholipid-binding lipoprotein MlaA
MSLSSVSAALLFASASVDGGVASCERAIDVSPATAYIETVRGGPASHGHLGTLAVALAAEVSDLQDAPGKQEPAQPSKPPEPDDIVVTGRLRPPPEDPAQAVNMVSFQVVQAVDQNLVRPAALAYSSTVPAPIRDGVRNFLDHLTEPVNAVNYLLQLKVGKAFETVARFAINSTLGVLGIFDMAKRKPFYLPLRINGFGNTMGYYGVKPGPFLYVPLIGPTTVRDLVGIILNRSFVPTFAGRPFNRPWFYIPSSVLGQIDRRAQLDEELQARRSDSRGAFRSSSRSGFTPTRNKSAARFRTALS